MAPLARNVANAKLAALSAGAEIIRQELIDKELAA
jgi:5-methyltetrahydropteroyltriglutamate--homocysteine methyltransferase